MHKGAHPDSCELDRVTERNVQKRRSINTKERRREGKKKVTAQECLYTERDEPLTKGSKPSPPRSTQRRPTRWGSGGKQRDSTPGGE